MSLQIPLVELIESESPDNQGSYMDKSEITQIVDAWIEGQETEKGADEHGRNWWAIERVMDWALHGEADLLWTFVLSTYNRNISDRVVSVLAAGPLEDLLAKYGPEFIERVEQLARQDKKFNFLLGGVWQNTMSKDVWKRVQAVRHSTW
jgi:hypothetical protein